MNNQDPLQALTLTTAQEFELRKLEILSQTASKEELRILLMNTTRQLLAHKALNKKLLSHPPAFHPSVLTERDDTPYS